MQRRKISSFDDAGLMSLSELLSHGKVDIHYIYDFGDHWQHRIVVEDVKLASPRTQYPLFLGGERRCPPEDCGGVPGYGEFLANIRSKTMKKRQAALAWYGGSYDPDEIDDQKITADLARIGKSKPSDRSK